MAKKDTQNDDPFAVNVAGTVAALAATFLAQKLINAGWKALSGAELPDEADDDAQMPKIVIAAALTGAVIALVRVSASRGARKYAKKRIDK